MKKKKKLTMIPMKNDRIRIPRSQQRKDEDTEQKDKN